MFNFLHHPYICVLNLSCHTIIKRRLCRDIQVRYSRKKLGFFGSLQSIFRYSRDRYKQRYLTPQLWEI